MTTQNDSNLCFQCAPNIGSIVNEIFSEQNPHSCPEVPSYSFNRTEGIWADIVEIRFLNFTTRVVLGYIVFIPLSMGTNFLCLHS